jgi:TRAP-type C4-dicarboxylate transport system substrate-binding protein
MPIMLNGSVKVEIYHGETLGKPTELIDLVGGGAIDIRLPQLKGAISGWTFCSTAWDLRCFAYAA